MQITLNGTPHPLDSEILLPALLDTLGLLGKPVIVELNQQPILPRNFPHTTIHPNDQIEIVALAAGG